ncbi:hypothetical protein [Moritella sp. F3]|uniref:hypothetical protein n=1 Tax=Moritella sp. F3 TaxID=2718882 RepID=UPI0018E0E942|nr:hypothetical protein [Moritella sp. F3]GIC79073.1 hypothetical protein FMO001_38000 [Moritella sp. F1]GIC81242.1 hypothetical protein FMO003_15230 [Moritella sp. F3]
MKLVKKTLVIATCLYLVGCASGAQVENMVYQGEQKSYPAVVQNNLALSSVTGGEDTNAAWTSEISDVAFSDAIKESLLEQGLFSEKGKYQLSARIVDVEQPLFGLDMTVTTKVKYTLTDTVSGKVILDEAVEAPHTATFGDAFSGVARLQMANEGSGKKNIEALLNKLAELNIEANEVSLTQ